jgi:hypothetical protein
VGKPAQNKTSVCRNKKTEQKTNRKEQSTQYTNALKDLQRPKSDMQLLKKNHT